MAFQTKCPRFVIKFLNPSRASLAQLPPERRRACHGDDALRASRGYGCWSYRGPCLVPPCGAFRSDVSYYLIDGRGLTLWPSELGPVI